MYRRGITGSLDSKRIICSAAFVLAGALLLGGCRKEETALVRQHKAEREELLIWAYYETNAQRDGMDALVRDFNQSQNRYTAAWEYVPMTGFAKGLTSAYTEDALPDMAILDNPDMPGLIQLGMFEDITDKALEWNLEEEYYSALVNTVEYQGKYYGVPFNCNNTALIYNQKMLEEEGIEPPETWEELRQAAAALTKEERSGFLLCGMEGEQGAFQLLSWVLAAGGDAGAAFAFLEQMLEDGSLPANCINLTQTDLSLEFINEKAAMMQNGPWVFPALEEAGISYGVIPIPGKKAGAAVAGGENIGILKGKNREGALAFLTYCVEQGGLEKFCEKAQVLPARISSAREYIKTRKNMEVFEEQMHEAVVRTSIDAWPSVSKDLTEGLYELVAGEKTAGEIGEKIKLKFVH